MREVWEGVGVVKGYGRAEPGTPPHPALMDYLFDPLLRSSEGSEERGPCRQALAQALYFGARGATAVNSQSSRRSGYNLLIKSVRHLPRVPLSKPRRPIRDLDPKTQLLLETQLTGDL